jgi:hypothetical protein
MELVEAAVLPLKNCTFIAPPPDVVGVGVPVGVEPVGVVVGVELVGVAVGVEPETVGVEPVGVAVGVEPETVGVEPVGVVVGVEPVGVTVGVEPVGGVVTDVVGVAVGVGGTVCPPGSLPQIRVVPSYMGILEVLATVPVKPCADGSLAEL